MFKCGACKSTICSIYLRDKLKDKNNEIVVALAGSPNVGKSTLFNVLTGARQKVANWPGTTVERKEGTIEYGKYKIRIVDLPGTYSLTAKSIEEAIARNFIVQEKPDVTVVILDSLALEKSLYLALQIMELTNKVVLALNKVDLADKKGVHIHVRALERRLGVPVVRTIATKGVGVKDLLRKIVELATGQVQVRPYKFKYEDLEEYLAPLEESLEKVNAFRGYDRKWVALRILEGDKDVVETLDKLGYTEILNLAEDIRRKIKDKVGLEAEVLIVSKRYDEITHILDGVLSYEKVYPEALTSKIDSLAMHGVLGIPIMFLVFGIMFLIVFSINTGFPLNVVFRLAGLLEWATIIEEYSLSSLLEQFFGSMGSYVADLLNSLNAPNWAMSLVVDGVLAGLGTILSFFPLIFLTFLFLGALEDSGYLARAAYISDRFLRTIGLSGKAFVPLIFGLGCNVPAVLATRILESENERKLAATLAPLVPCQARLIVLLALVALIVPGSPLGQALTVLTLYIINFTVLALLGIVFSKTIVKGEAAELLIEIPPYHIPNARVLMWHAWDHSVHFLKKAGTIILILSIVTWFLLVYSPSGYIGPEVFENPSLMSKSLLAVLSRTLLPLAKPLGINNWVLVASLITGFIAKEAVLGTIGILTVGSEEFAVENICTLLGLTPLSTFTFLVFVNLYVPCMATIAVVFQETRSIKLTLLTIAYEVLVAYVVSLIIFNLGAMFFTMVM